MDGPWKIYPWSTRHSPPVTINTFTPCQAWVRSSQRPKILKTFKKAPKLTMTSELINGPSIDKSQPSMDNPDHIKSTPGFGWKVVDILNPQILIFLYKNGKLKKSVEIIEKANE